jgi:hypothetical protein
MIPDTSGMIPDMYVMETLWEGLAQAACCRSFHFLEGHFGRLWKLLLSFFWRGILGGFGGFYSNVLLLCNMVLGRSGHLLLELKKKIKNSFPQTSAEARLKKISEI